MYHNPKQNLPTIIKNNNSNRFPNHSLISEIINLQNYLKNINLFEDTEIKSLTFDTNKNWTQKHKNLNKKIITDIQQLNIDYHHNILSLKNKFRKMLKTHKINNEKKEIYLTQKINKQKNKDILKKQKINSEFEYIKKITNNQLQNSLASFKNLENQINLQQEEEQKIFVKKNLQIIQINQQTKADINKLFYQKNVILNEKIKKLKCIFNESIKQIEYIYQDNQENIKNSEKKQQEIYINQIKQINNIFQQKLDNHNKNFDETKNFFLQKQNIITRKKQLLINNNQIQMFFFVKQIYRENYKNIMLIIKMIYHNQLIYLKKLHIWRQKYIILKFICHKKLNKINQENKLFAQTKHLQTNHVLFTKEKEKNIIQNNYLQKINSLEMELKLLSQNTQNKITTTEFTEENQKNKLELDYLSKSLQIKAKLADLKYHQTILSLQQKKTNAKALLKKQLKIEKINLKSKYFEQIINNYQKIKQLKKQLTELQNKQEYEINLQNIIYRQQKQNYLHEIEIEKIKTNKIIEQYFITQKKNLSNIISFIFNINIKHNQQKKIFCVITKRLNKLIFNRTKTKKIFSRQELDEINNLYQIFIDNIKDKQFYYHYLLKNMIYNHHKMMIKQEKNVKEIILNFYEKNISFISVLVYKFKFKNKNTNTFFLNFFETKMKKYSNLETLYKKNFITYEQQKKNISDKLKKEIDQLKYQQNKIFQKYNFYQKKIFIYLKKIHNLKNANSFISQIFYYIYSKKIFTYWHNYISIIQSYDNQFQKEYNFSQSYIHQIQDQKQNNKINSLKENQKQINNISNIFIEITKEMYNQNIQNILTVNKQETEILKEKITSYEKENKTQLNQMKENINLVQENLEFTSHTIEKEFLQKINKNKIEYYQKRKNLFSKIQKKLDAYEQISKIKLLKEKIITKNQKTNIQKILIYHKNKQKKYLHKNLIFLKEINKNKKKTNTKISQILWKNKIYSLIDKVIWWFQHKKNKKELEINYQQTQIRLKKNMIKQIKLYKNLINLFGT
ncbi:MAG: hypothetical protein Q8899_01660 [Weeping tea tree witches'-broom phytoplasma]|uniref:hypothetical protein n=1 Tax=Candidatus Phytoplasma melaleucae TaxID=2982630 RepID=UPI00293AD4DC|nr:hypothetical protein [Weeping tea tree witches'-broom phytoplasma]